MSGAPIPSGWNKTHADLAAELQSGKRARIVREEMDWATQYEQSQLPPDIRFPKVGEIYETLQDADVEFEIYFAAPVTNNGGGRLFKGERVKIKYIMPQERPIRALAQPVKYRAVEKRFLSDERREPPYSHFFIVFTTVELSAGFRQVRPWGTGDLARLLGK